MKKIRILILGGGFAGIYGALEFERRCDPQFDVTLISQDNFFLFTAMLHEVACGDLDVTHIVKPIRQMLRHVRFFEGQILSVALRNRLIAHLEEADTECAAVAPIPVPSRRSQTPPSQNILLTFSLG